MDYQLVVALLLAGTGWLLNELSQGIRRRNARTAAAGQALAELLEIRHYLIGTGLAFDAVQARLPVPAADAVEGLRWLDQLLPPDPLLPARYEAAVCALATTSPLTAFQLRSKDQVPLILTRLRAIQLHDSSYPNLLLEGDGFARRHGIEAIEDSIRKLAWLHGICTWFEIRRMLTRPSVLPQAAIEFIDQALKSEGRQADLPVPTQRSQV